MAQGFASALSGGGVESFSAGSRPAGFVSPQAVAVMREAGIDISSQKSKGLSHIPQERYDAIVTMGCGDACPQFAAKRRFDWNIPDPMGGSDEDFRSARETIRRSVLELLKEMGAAPPSD